MAISKQLVELMNGEIGFTSKEGFGTTFWFTLPMPTEAQSGAGTDSVSDNPIIQDFVPVAPGKTFPKGIRVLLCEDNPVNQKLISKLSGTCGARYSWR